MKSYHIYIRAYKRNGTCYISAGSPIQREDPHSIKKEPQKVLLRNIILSGKTQQLIYNNWILSQAENDREEGLKRSYLNEYFF